MITNAQKEVLNELLLTETVSDILQVMVGLAVAEARRLGRPIITLKNARPVSLQSCYAQKQAMIRVEVLEQATREATARETAAGFVGNFAAKFGQPVQTALL